MKPNTLSDAGGLRKLTKSDLEKLPAVDVKYLALLLSRHVEEILQNNWSSQLEKVDHSETHIGYVLNCLRTDNAAVQKVLATFANISDIRDDRRPSFMDLLRAYEKKILPVWASPLVRETNGVSYVNLGRAEPQEWIDDIALDPNLDRIIQGIQMTPDGHIRCTPENKLMIWVENASTRTCPLYLQSGRYKCDRRILNSGEIATVSVSVCEDFTQKQKVIKYQIGKYDPKTSTYTLYLTLDGHDGVVAGMHLIETDGVVSGAQDTAIESRNGEIRRVVT